MKMVKNYSFDEWQALGHDRHSVFADPLFADPQHGDFTVTDGTILERIGFVPFLGAGKDPQ